MFSDLFDFISVSRSSSCINKNSLISCDFSFSFSDFNILGDFDDFEYFGLNFLIIFKDSDLEVEGEIFGIFISFSIFVQYYFQLYQFLLV